MSVRPIIRFAMLLYVSAACLAANAHAAESAPTPLATGFDFATLERTAQALAQAPFVPDRGVPGEDLEYIDGYMQYREINHDIKRCLWRDESLPFHLQLFHRGFLFKDRVFINVVEEARQKDAVPLEESIDGGDLRRRAESSVLAIHWKAIHHSNIVFLSQVQDAAIGGRQEVTFTTLCDLQSRGVGHALKRYLP